MSELKEGRKEIGKDKEKEKERKKEKKENGKVKGMIKERKRKAVKISTIQFTASEKARSVNLEIEHEINET